MGVKIQVLGTGCPNCQRLAENAEQAASALALDFELEKITDIGQILSFAVLSTPALALDGAVISSGRVATAEEIRDLLATRLALSPDNQAGSS